jgi:hypothetical protein
MILGDKCFPNTSKVFLGIFSQKVFLPFQILTLLITFTFVLICQYEKY